MLAYPDHITTKTCHYRFPVCNINDIIPIGVNLRDEWMGHMTLNMYMLQTRLNLCEERLGVSQGQIHDYKEQLGHFKEVAKYPGYMRKEK